MALNFESTIDFTDEDIVNFLLDPNTQEKEIANLKHTGYFSPQGNKKAALFDPIFQDISIKVIEKYNLYRALLPWPIGKTVPDNSDQLLGEQELLVINSIQVSINSGFELFLKDGIDENAVKEELDKLRNYQPANVENVNEFAEYLQKEIHILKEDDYIIDACITIEKQSALKDLDSSQRDEFLKMYKYFKANNSRINAVDSEYTLGQMCQDENIHVVFMGYELKGPETPSSLLTIESSINLADFDQKTYNEQEQHLGSLIDGVAGPVLDKLFPLNCGDMKRHQFKLLTLFAWPEFKFALVPVKIKIGCVHITIFLPEVKVRISKLIFYVYYSIFKSAGNSILKIAERCALKSAIEAGVVGVLTLNPAAASGQFQESFKTCVFKDIWNCINAGIFTLKVSGNWS